MSHYVYIIIYCQVKIAIPMKFWSAYLQTAFAKWEVRGACSYMLDEGAPEVVERMQQLGRSRSLQLAKTNGKRDVTGNAWKACFKKHSQVRKTIAKKLNIIPFQQL